MEQQSVMVVIAEYARRLSVADARRNDLSARVAFCLKQRCFE
jgi:hypothetical protein